MKKLICFDLDGTLTPTGTPLAQENRQLLDRLSHRYRLLMVSARAAGRIAEQMAYYPIHIIGNYGMEEGVAREGAFFSLRAEKLPVDRAFFEERIARVRQQYGYTDYRGDSLIFHETGLVTFPLLGSLAPISTKLAFDPKREKRARLLPVLREIFSEHTVYYGGSSSFDFCDPRFDKHTAVMRFAAENGYQKEEILFVGDDFGDGGGDCHVRLGGLDYIEIADYRLLGERLAPLL